MPTEIKCTFHYTVDERSSTMFRPMRRFKQQIAEETPAAVLGKTTLPEFSIITTQGIEVFEDLTVFSASKDGNNIILMDKNRSFYELPRDKVLEGYNKQFFADMGYSNITYEIVDGRMPCALAIIKN